MLRQGPSMDCLFSGGAGLIGHFLDQNRWVMRGSAWSVGVVYLLSPSCMVSVDSGWHRLKQGLYRHPTDDISYLVGGVEF